MPPQPPVQQGPAVGASQQNPGVGPPFLGLFLDRPAHAIPMSGFSACSNVQIYLNTVTNWNCGWSSFLTPSQLTPSSNITGGGIFQLSTLGFQYLVVANATDLYVVNESIPLAPTGYLNATLGAGGPFYITPVYTTGTASCAGGTTVTGIGTQWNTNIGTAGFRKNVRQGDFISFTLDQNSIFATWFQVLSVTNDTSLELTGNGPITGAGAYTIRQTMNNDTFDNRVAMEAFPNAGAPDSQDVCLFANFGGTNRLGGLSLVGPGVDPIVLWDPTKKHAVYLSTFAFTCGLLRRFNNVMIYGRLCPAGVTSTTDLQQTQIATSDNGLPRTVAGGVTFQGTVSDGPEPIQYLGILGNTLLIYTGSNSGAGVNTVSAAAAKGSIITAQFVGLPTVWQFQTVVRGRSALTGLLIQEFTDRHEFITIEGQFRYNGMFLQVMNDHVWRGIFGNIDLTSLRLAFSVQMPTLGQVIWYVPVLTPSTNPITMIGYCEHYGEMANSYLFKPYSQRDGTVLTGSTYALTSFLGSNSVRDLSVAAASGGAFVGAGDGSVRVFGAGALPSAQKGASAMASSVTFGSRVIAGERSRGLVKRIYPYLESQQVGSVNVGPLQSASPFTLTVTLKLQDRIGGAVAITDAQTIKPLALDGGSANRFTTHYRRGRVASVTFSTTGIVDAGGTGDCTFVLDGYDWDVPLGSKGGQR